MKMKKLKLCRETACHVFNGPQSIIAKKQNPTQSKKISFFEARKWIGEFPSTKNRINPVDKHVKRMQIEIVKLVIQEVALRTIQADVNLVLQKLI